jgi:hypothetical protein
MEQIQTPSNFRSVIGDFTRDLSITFPEFSYLWEKWTLDSVPDTEIDTLYQYSMTVYPERFFDILYQNDEIFNADSTTNTAFLPNVDFKLLVNCEGISETTKKAIWKYLQLVLFSIVGGVKDKANFGDTMNLFDGIDENELQAKLNETMGNLTDFFKNMDSASTSSASTSSEGGEGATESGEQGEQFKRMFEGMPNMPNMEDLHGHLKTLFDGKIGKLAREMAEEISGEFSGLMDGDMNDVKSTEDVMKKLMKNPKKIMDLMKTVGGKLDSKMKSGEISRDEIMKEAGDLLSKMKEMGGKDQFTDMLKTMAKNMGGMGKNMRIDTNAIDRLTKQASTRDRMLSKLEQKKRQQAEQLEKLKVERQKQMELQNSFAANYSLQQTSSPNNLVFKLDGEEKQEKSFIHPDLLKEMEEEDKKKTGDVAKSSNKKKKNKGKK